MSARIPSNPKKFPYILIESGDNVDDVGPQGKKHEVDRMSPNNHGGIRLLPFGGQVPDHIPALTSFMPAPIPISSRGSSQHHLQNPNAAAYNLSKMKAILTAQNEMRQPASSLYPSASQMSLIPETEEIYRKYFPKEEPTQNSARVSCRKGRDLGKQGGAYTLVTDGDDIKFVKDTGAALSSSSESMTRRQRPVSSLIMHDMEEIPGSGRNHPVTPEIMSSPPPSSPTDKQVTRQCIKDAELKFKKRIQSQFLSISSEMERQSSELSDLRKELKDMKQATRKSTSDQDGTKSRLDTLTKQVQDIDSKMDTLQESVTSQEKSFLSKLMLLGDVSDSDSDESSDSMKYFDPIRSSSCTKLTLSSARGKRTGSAGTPGTIVSPSRSIADAFPRVCNNWIPIAPDFDKLIHSIAILNYRMDRNQSMKVATASNGNRASFKHSDVIDLALYKNGMTLGSTGFRSYSTMSVIKFVNEIFNGYLPTELSTQYPDGVVIVLTDNRSINSSNGFNGAGTKLVKQDDPSPPELFPGKSINSLEKKKDTSSGFTVLSASATESQCSVSVSVSTQNDCDILPDLITETGESRRSAKTIRLKVNDTKNGKKYKLKVSINTTIKKLTEHLTEALYEREDLQDIVSTILSNRIEVASLPKTYDLILPVPHGKLACLDSTLEDYGITQNTLLCVQEQRKAQP